MNKNSKCKGNIPLISFVGKNGSVIGVVHSELYIDWMDYVSLYTTTTHNTEGAEEQRDTKNEWINECSNENKKYFKNQ